MFSGAKSELYPIVVRYYDSEVGKVVTGLLGVPALPQSSTGENIFLLIDQAVKKSSKWEHAIGYCSDNAAVMLGKNKGVAAFVKN